MSSTRIYVLKCPVSGDVRYVGKCVNLKSRLRQHISEARLGCVRSHKCSWIRSLLKAGLRPIIEVDAVVPEGICWKSIEIDRIAWHRDNGCDLTNATEGGDHAGNLSEEGRRLLSERASKQFGTPEGRQHQSDLMRELCRDPKFVKARDAAAKATRATPAYKAKASARSKAKWADPTYRAKMKRARAELNADPEFRKKLSQAVGKAMASPDVRTARAEKSKAAWKNPEIRARQTAAIRAAVSKSALGGTSDRA